MNEPTVAAKVVRYRIARIRVAQALVPVAVLVTFAARLGRATGAIYVAVVVQMAALVSFALARRSWRRRPIHVIGGHIQFDDDEQPIVPARIKRWTFSGSTARLYGKDVSWRLSVATKDRVELRATLSRVLGQPITLAARGTPRARHWALAIAMGGLVLTGVALGAGVMPLFPVGVLCLLGGGATFGALSQKVERGSARE